MSIKNSNVISRIDPEQHNRVQFGDRGEILVSGSESPEIEDVIAEQVCAILNPGFETHLAGYLNEAFSSGKAVSAVTVSAAIADFIETRVQDTPPTSSTRTLIPPLKRGNDDNSEGEYFPGAVVSEIGEVMMQDIVGCYDVPDQVPEWAWIEKEATFNHVKNGEAGIWEFVLNLSRMFTDVPALLQPVIEEARGKKLAYLIFHQGT